MKGKVQNKLTEQDLVETREWLNKSEQHVPKSVFTVLITLINLYSILVSGISKFKAIRNFLAQEMGIIPKSEKVTLQDGKDIVDKKRKLKPKKLHKIFVKTRTGRKQEELAVNTPTHAYPAKKIAENCEYPTEKQHPLASVEPTSDNNIIENDSVKEEQKMPKNIIKISQTNIAADICLLAQERKFEIQGTQNNETGEVIYEQHPELEQGSGYTYLSIATFVVLHVGHQIPITRIANMIAIKGKTLAKSTIFGFIVKTAEAFLPVFYILTELLFKNAQAIHTDDTNEKTLRAQAEDLTCDETQIDSTPALDIARKIHDKIGLVSKDDKGKPRKMHLTVFSGLTDQKNPKSRIILKISHFGCAGHLASRLITKYRNEKISQFLWIICDMLNANRPSEDIIKKYKIKFAGCSAHARRRIWKYRSLDDIMWAVIRGFKALTSMEEKIVRIGAANNPEKILEWRKKYGRKIWKFITAYCVKITNKWPKGTEPYKAADYILNNEFELKRYLDTWYLPATNNLAERLLRPEKLMLSSSKFRANLGGRICYDIISSVMATCLSANVNFISYTIDVLRNKTDVAMNPEIWTPLAWSLRQQQPKK